MTRTAADGGRPLRIGLMVEDFPVISETFVINMAAGLLGDGHDVTILAMSGQKPVPEPMHDSVRRWGLEDRTKRPVGGRVLIGAFARKSEHRSEGEVPARWGLPRRATAFAAQAAMLARTPRFDVVHCQFAHLGLTAARHREIGSLRTSRLVVHVRGQDVTSFVRAHNHDVYRDLFATADLVVANSRHFRDRAVDLGARGDRVEVIGSAVDCSRFVPSEAPDDSSGSEGEVRLEGEVRSEGEVRLVTVGRLVPKKGIDVAIRAVADLTRDYPGIHLDVVGEGPQREALAALITEIDADDHVTLVGALTHEQIIERFARSDALVAVSLTPRSGDQDAPVNSLKEAMAMGLPVIGSRHGGIPELVEPGVNGYLVDEGDHVGLAATIRRAIAERQDWFKLGQAGRQRILDEYDLPVVTARLIDAYRSLWPVDRAPS